MGGVWPILDSQIPVAAAQDEPPPEGEGEATPLPSPTPTRRPTRTPRATASPTATPLPAGALRMVLAVEPAAPGDDAVPLAVGVPFRASVRLVNVAELPAHDLTLEVTLPDALLADDARAPRGEVTRDGPVVRWYLPLLDPASEASLDVVGVAAAEAGGLRGQPLCALLLSRAAPIEHCLEIRVAAQPGAIGAGGGDADAGGANAGAGAPALPTAATGLGFADVVAGSPRVLAGWGLLALGLGILGLWAGVSMRGRTPRTAVTSEPGAGGHPGR